MATIQRVSFIFIVVCFATVSALGADKWDAPASEVSRRIMALAGTGPLSFEVRNASSIPPDQVAIIRRSIDGSLRAQGVQLREAAQGFATVRVTLSENIRGWIWIVEVPGSQEPKVSMLSIPRETSTASPNGSMTLRRALVFAGKDEILDAAPLSKNGEHVVVLSPSFVSVYLADPANRTWNLERSFSIPHSTYPQDLRGRLKMDSDGEFTAYLPGIQCHGKALQPDSSQCINSDDPWWLGGTTNAFFNSAHNHFTGVVPGLMTVLPPFFSAAVIRPKADTWVISTLDGQVNLVDGKNLRAVGGTRDWGSDIASVRSGCGSGAQVLVSGMDDGASDSVRAFEIPEFEAVPVSVPLVFEGSITALWTKPQGDTAAAVVRTPTGAYEAYSVSIACSQ